MGSSARVLVVGFDAADGEIMLELARQGRLPAVRSLLEKGVRTEVQNPPGLFVGAVWPSFFTGTWPGRHGRYCYAQLRPGTYEAHRVHATDVRGEPFWAALGRAGHRTAIVDVPQTHVAGWLGDGIHVVDWGRHDPNVGFQTWPSELASDIIDRFGMHPVERCDNYARAGAFGELTRGLLAGIDRKADLVEFLLDQDDWSLFLVVFSESHCVGHACWFLHDREHPRHDAGLAAALGDPLLDVYEALDGALGRLLARVGDETLVLLLLSHGMGPHYDGNFLLDEILLRIEAANRPFGRVRRVGPELRRVARRAVRGGRRRLGLSPARRAPFDGARPFFQIPNNDVYGGIRINQIGREPSGRVAPGRDFDRACDLIAEGLATWTNLETGEPLVRAVLRTADLYQGPGTAAMPDLLVEWNRDRPIRSIAAPGCGRIDGEWTGARSGDHRSGGMLFARGLGGEPGSKHEPVRVVDLAPTICAALGTPLIETDGRPLAALT
jgi:predicted AlkP superfamily phosphohydrolase/phosphomutase